MTVAAGAEIGTGRTVLAAFQAAGTEAAALKQTPSYSVLSGVTSFQVSWHSAVTSLSEQDTQVVSGTNADAGQAMDLKPQQPPGIDILLNSSVQDQKTEQPVAPQKAAPPVSLVPVSPASTRSQQAANSSANAVAVETDTSDSIDTRTSNSNGAHEKPAAKQHATTATMQEQPAVVASPVPLPAVPIQTAPAANPIASSSAVPAHGAASMEKPQLHQAESPGSAAAAQQSGNASPLSQTETVNKDNRAVRDGLNGAEDQNDQPADALQTVARSSPSTDKHSTDTIATQSVHEATSAATDSAITSTSAHATNVAEDMVAPVHSSSGAAQAPVTSIGNRVPASPAQETFAALDGATGQSTSWVHAGPRSAEAGFEDPTLGWIGVRADMGADGVHAAVVPGTPAAAAELGAHMAGLSTYLSEHRAGVEILTLASPESYAGSDSGFHRGTQQGSGQDPAGQNAANTQPAYGHTFSLKNSRSPAASGTDTGAAQPVWQSGHSISVVV